MAEPWIKMRCNLDTNPKVVMLAAELGLDELHVVGCLFKIWTWADTHTIDANALCVTTAFLDRLTRVTGFADALRKIGWLEGRDSALTFSRFAEHNGQTAKTRAETARRVAKHQANKQKIESETPNKKLTEEPLEMRLKTNEKNVSSALPREDKIREEKRREEHPKPLAGEGVGIGAGVEKFKEVSKRIRGLLPAWASELTHFERAELERELACFDAYPWDDVSEWLASGPAKPPSNRKVFIQGGGTSERARAQEWKKTKQKKSEPANLEW